MISGSFVISPRATQIKPSLCVSGDQSLNVLKLDLLRTVAPLSYLLITNVTVLFLSLSTNRLNLSSKGPANDKTHSLSYIPFLVATLINTSGCDIYNLIPASQDVVTQTHLQRHTQETLD